MSALETLLSQHALDRAPKRWLERLARVTDTQVRDELARPFAPFSLARLATLVSPAARPHLEAMAQLARRITVQRFGRTMLLYAPLYVSNYCVSHCAYCGFRSGAGVRRMRLPLERVRDEAERLREEGFRHLLLVAGEDPKHIDVDYLTQAASMLRERFSSIAIEVHQLPRADYARLVDAGVDGLVLYQETYDRDLYAQVHVSGPKADYARRLTAHDDSGAAGVARMGIGALLGLTPWPFEALAVGLHAHYLGKTHWRSQVSISFPRLRPTNTTEFQPRVNVSDADLAQMITALRITFPDLGLVLSTREPASLRDRFCFLGITQMSAGSRTNPGGYHNPDASERQFEISDDRSPADVADYLATQGFDPVWKDWDAGLVEAGKS